MTSKWPWPADSPLDIARRLLQSYRSALEQIDPEACRLIDANAADLGQGWVNPKIETVNPDDLVSAVEAAALVGVEVATIYQWASRKHIPRHHAAAARRGTESVTFSTMSRPPAVPALRSETAVNRPLLDRLQSDALEFCHWPT